MRNVVLISALVLITVTGVLCDELLRESEHEIIYRIKREARVGKGRGTDGQCRYKKGPWQDCDSVTNTQSRALTLKKGGSNCEQNKLLTKKCRKACRYEKGEWNPCDTTTGTKTRTDSLKPKSDSSCQTSRQITKKCQSACRYEKDEPWSDCDQNGQKSKVLTLNSGPAGECPPKKTVTKSCRQSRKYSGKRDS